MCQLQLKTILIKIIIKLQLKKKLPTHTTIETNQI